jgi:hypothetical protein
MSSDIFTDPEDARENWVDVRMSDPDQGEWDIDAVVVDGRVEYVDLRVQPALLADFVECLVDDVSEERANRIVRSLVDRRDLSIQDQEHEGDDQDV